MRFINAHTRSTLAARIVLAAVAGSLATSSQASGCKGLDQPTCAADAACKWVPERKAGETKNRDGSLSKVSAKAHCRKPRPVTTPATEAAPDQKGKA